MTTTMVDAGHSSARGPRDAAGTSTTLVVLMLAGTSFGLMQSLLLPALPQLERAFDTNSAGAAWILTSFLLSTSVLTPIIGRTGDLYGKQRMLVIVLAVFSVGILVSALAPNLSVMIIGRAIQGIGGGVFPLAFGIIRDQFPRERIAGGIGAVSSVVGIGGGVGLILPGIILEALSFRWLFWIPLILTLIATVAVVVWVPNSKPRGQGGVNLFSAGLMAVGLVALLLGVSEVSSWGYRSIAAFAVAAVFLVAWIGNDLRARQPLIDMSMMRTRSVWAVNVVALLLGAGMFASFLLIPLYVETPPDHGFGFGASVIVAGLFVVPTAVPQLVVGPLAGFFERHIGSRGALVCGSAALALSLGVLAALSHQAVWIFVATTLIGIGLGLALPGLANVVVSAVPREHTGAATAMNTVMRNIGGSLGSQIAATIVAGTATGTGYPREQGYTTAYLVVCLAAVGALVLTFMITAGSRTRHSTDEHPSAEG